MRIPRGVRQGQHIRLAGQGSAGIGQGKAGDLYLEVEFKPRRNCRIDGKDVFIDLPVAPWEAALGATVEVTTPSGKVELAPPEVLADLARHADALAGIFAEATLHIQVEPACDPNPAASAVAPVCRRPRDRRAARRTPAKTSSIRVAKKRPGLRWCDAPWSLRLSRNTSCPLR